MGSQVGDPRGRPRGESWYSVAVPPAVCTILATKQHSSVPPLPTCRTACSQGAGTQLGVQGFGSELPAIPQHRPALWGTWARTQPECPLRCPAPSVSPSPVESQAQPISPLLLGESRLQAQSQGLVPERQDHAQRLREALRLRHRECPRWMPSWALSSWACGGQMGRWWVLEGGDGIRMDE